MLSLRLHKSVGLFLAIGYWLLAISYQPSAISYQPGWRASAVYIC
jgi:hypothetical protein